MRRGVFVLSLLLVAAVCVVVQPVPVGATAGACEDLPGASLVGGELDGSTPVVLVHGFTGSNVSWFAPIDQAIDDDVEVHNRSFIEQLLRIDGVSVWLFEYHDTSARWVTDPSIGPALADLLECLAGNGGQPSVLAVHSMGGLAARYALSLVDDPGVVSGLVTFGTPHLGSDIAAWMSGALGVVDVASMASNPLLGSVWSFVHRDLEACAAARTISVDDAECGWVGGVPPLGSEAGAALQRGSSAVMSLPPVPDHVSVLGLAGQIDIVLQESVWGFFYSDIGRVSIGDTMVMVDSATAQSDTTNVRTCQLNLKTGYAISDDFRELAQINYDDGKERGISALMSNPCQHSNLMHTVEITNEALYHVNTIVEAQRPIVFPRWRIPWQGDVSAVVYVGAAEYGAEDASEVMQMAHDRLAEIGMDLWEGYGSLGCDQGAEAALGVSDRLALGVYFDTEAEALEFAAAWESYFGEPPYGVVAEVKSFCLD